MAKGRKYGLFNLFWDVVLVMITGGLWVLWIVIREVRL